MPLGALVRNDLLRHAGIVFVGMLVVHVINLFFQMAVSRALPASEYALLAAFLGVMMILQRPLLTLTTGLARFSSLLIKEGRTGDVKRLLIKWLWWAGVPAALLGMVIILGHQTIMTWLHLDRPEPLLVAGAILPALFWLPVVNGAGQGAQLFKWCTAAAIGGALARLLLGAGFVWWLYPACGWAMLGHGLGLYVTVGLLAAGIGWQLRAQRRSTRPLPHLRGFLGYSFLAQLSFAVLMTADVILVKHFVPLDTEFAYAATLGRMVVFLPGAIVASMLPKVSTRGAGSKEQEQIFSTALRWTFVFVATSVIGVWLLAGPLAHLLFGIQDASPYLTRMMGVMATVMGLTAVLNVILNYHLAQRRFHRTWPLIVCAGGYLAASFLFHDTAWPIVIAAAVANAIATLALWHRPPHDDPSFRKHP